MSKAIPGAEVIKTVRRHQDKTLLAFSTGKDAIAAWLAIRDHFDEVVPYYLYLVPGLEFVEESLAYYERFFGCRIHRLPHPSLHRWLNALMYQAPENIAVIEQAGLPEFDYADIQRAMVQAVRPDLQNDMLVADGVRAADSPMRRIAISKNGPISFERARYHPVWDMLKADLIDMFRAHNVKLPVDYKIFGRSFDGLDLRFLMPIKKHFPRDYQKILEWFPLADIEIARYEFSIRDRVKPVKGV